MIELNDIFRFYCRIAAFLVLIIGLAAPAVSFSLDSSRPVADVLCTTKCVDHELNRIGACKLQFKAVRFTVSYCVQQTAVKARSQVVLCHTELGQSFSSRQSLSALKQSVSWSSAAPAVRLDERLFCSNQFRSFWRLVPAGELAEIQTLREAGSRVRSDCDGRSSLLVSH